METFVSDKKNAMIQYLTERMAPHTIETQSTSCALSVRNFDLGKINIAEISYSDDVLINPARLEDGYLIQSTNLPGSWTERCGERVDLSNQNVLVSSPGDYARFFMPKNVRHVTIKIPRDIFEDCVFGKYESANFNQSSKRNDVQSASLANMWRSLLSHLIEIAAHHPTKLEETELIDHFSIKFAEMLSYGTDALSIRDRRAHERVLDCVFRAKSYIDSHYCSEISISNVANELGVSTRSLQNYFKDTFLMTPSQYLKQKRLIHLRKLIRNSDRSKSITSLMLDSGINSFGRYADFYAREFGTLPSQELVQSDIN